MDEEQKELTPSSQTKYKWIKAMTLVLVFISVFFALGSVGVETTSTSNFCSSCHEMKPQYYTWEASTHSEVDCVSCHTESGTGEYVKAKANGLVEVYKKTTDSYNAPIKMPDIVPDETCEKCHNINTRNFSLSGDLITSHTKHKEEKIECVQCHSGVAHGKISDRKVTYKSDYEKWNEKLGVSLMSDKKYTSPQMKTCIECHEVRNAPLECSACHASTMVPDNHKTEKFKAGEHGKIDPSELQKCEKCHSYMSTEEYDLFKEQPAYTKYLNKSKSEPTVTVAQYAKTNTFCKDCHGQRPISHQRSQFMTDHGQLSKDTDTCFTCHDNRIASDSPVTYVQCASCHPSSHNNNLWKERHPVKLAENQKFNKTCLQCHAEQTCTKCHRPSSEQHQVNESNPGGD